MWLPILGGDERAVAVEASEMFKGIDVPQFWDGETRLGREIGRGLGVDGWVAWDIYLFYPPDAVWSDAEPPEPEAVLAQAAGDARREILNAIRSLIASADWAP